MAARVECGRLLAPSAQLHTQQERGSVAAEAALSRLVAALSQRLYTADNKHLTVLFNRKHFSLIHSICCSLAAVRRWPSWRPPFHPCVTLWPGAASPPPRRKPKKILKGLFWKKILNCVNLLVEILMSREVGERLSCPAALLLSSAAALLASAQVTVDLSCQQQLLTFSTLLFQGAKIFFFFICFYDHLIFCRVGGQRPLKEGSGRAAAVASSGRWILKNGRCSRAAVWPRLQPTGRLFGRHGGSAGGQKCFALPPLPHEAPKRVCRQSRWAFSLIKAF